MTALARKGVLLRLTPELLAKVDVARGALNRTAWITAVIAARLEAIAEADAVRDDEEFGEPTPVHLAIDTDVGTHAEHIAYAQGALDYARARGIAAIIEEDGTALDLTATPRDDGVLEIGHAGGLFCDTVSPQGEGSGTPIGDEPHGEHEGPDRGSHTLDFLPREESSETVRTDGGGEWGGATPRESADSEELADTVPPSSPSGEPADQGYSLPVDPGECGKGSDPALTLSASPPEQGPREPGTVAEGESEKGSDTARDADTTRDTVSPPNNSTDGVGWPD